jgi:hypothetical protein
VSLLGRSARPRLISLGILLGLLLLASPVKAATWTVQTTPNEGENSALRDISCEPETISSCYSVGRKATKGVIAPYAQFWNGSSWESKSPAPPSESTSGELLAVDCAGVFFESQFCGAAGSYSTTSGPLPLVELTFGGWFPATTPTPAGATETRLEGISCMPGSLQCMAVGYSIISGTKTAISMKGETSYSLIGVPLPAGAKSSELRGVDCPAFNRCYAVGSYINSEGKEWAMALSYNGTSWTQMTVPKPTGSLSSALLDISCGGNCYAVGVYRNASNVQVTLAERYIEPNWTYVESPNPSGSSNTVFQNVYCRPHTTLFCVAVGDYFSEKLKAWIPMAQEWGGSKWLLDTTSIPAGATFSLLEGVDCGSGSNCRAAGWYVNSESKERTLDETR